MMGAPSARSAPSPFSPWLPLAVCVCCRAPRGGCARVARVLLHALVHAGARVPLLQAWFRRFLVSGLPWHMAGFCVPQLPLTCPTCTPLPARPAAPRSAGQLLAAPWTRTWCWGASPQTPPASATSALTPPRLWSPSPWTPAPPTGACRNSGWLVGWEQPCAAGNPGCLCVPQPPCSESMQPCGLIPLHAPWLPRCRPAAMAWEAAFVRLASTTLADMAAGAGLRLSFSTERSVQDELARESTSGALWAPRHACCWCRRCCAKG